MTPEEREPTEGVPRVEKEEAAGPVDEALVAEPEERRGAEELGEREGVRAAARERPRRPFGRRRVCAFCVENVRFIDYKDPARLRRYISDRARIDARRKTGTCAKHQRWLAVALKRARHLALLPYAPEHIRATGMFAARR